MPAQLAVMTIKAADIPILPKPGGQAVSHVPGPVIQAFEGDKSFMRLDFGSPEAVRGFLLSAYRPIILPPKQGLANAMHLDEDLDESSFLVRSHSLLPSQPAMERTDMPLVDLCENHNMHGSPAALKCSSLPNVEGLDTRLQLAARSGSAPASMTLKVSDVWANVSETPARNPFNDILDQGTFFGND